MSSITNRLIKVGVATGVAAVGFTSLSSVQADGPAILFQSGGKDLSDQNKVLYFNNVKGYYSNIGPELGVVTLPHDWPAYVINAHTGTTAIRFSGTANGGASTFCCMQAFNVDIPITATTKLTYWIFPQYENAKFEKVDFHCTDGSTLHGVGGIYNFTQTDALSHQPGQIPINAWSEISCNVGQLLQGKTVDAIWVVYDRSGSYGQFRGYISDIHITSAN